MTHLKSIGVKNFRVFKEETTFNLAPITVLTGPNNSGKSSLIKIIKLLNENVNFNNRLDNLQFHIGTHSLGSYKKVISWNSKSEAIKIVLPFPLKYFDEKFYIELVYVPAIKNRGKLNYFKIFNRDRILVEFYNNPSLEQADPNKEDRDNISEIEKSEFNLEELKLAKNINYSYLIKTAFELKDKSKQMIEEYKRETQKHSKNLEATNKNIFKNFVYENPYSHHIENFSSVFDDFYNKGLNMPPWNEIDKYSDIKEGQMLYDFYKESELVNDNISHKEQIEKHYEWILNNFHHCPVKIGYEELFEHKNIFEWFYDLMEIFTKRIEKIGEFNIEISNLGKIILKDLLVENIKKTIDEMEKSFKSINYLSVNRGDQSRLYSLYGNMELNELLYKFDELLTSGPRKWQVQKFINHYLKELKIGVELKINKIEDAAFTIKVKSIETGKEISLSDLGFGYSQLIPILLKIAIIALSNTTYEWLSDSIAGYSPSVFLLEEPEANLHPNFQSKLADIFVDAGKSFNIQFIIETHSEYLIRKLQYLTAKKEIKPEDSVIFYFNHPDEVAKGAEQVKEIKILEDGGFSSDFGPGFFDEATNLKFELLRLKNPQKN